ncbi:MAG: dienelactone hydrolase family protein [Chitinophagales bacterium]|nr:dienelactone hydrolase family protein [Chitinophagales bacterium]
MTQGNDTLRYRILYPQNYLPQKKYPLIIFLHGSGESGIDNENQLVHGGDLFLKKDVREKFPALILFPQCPPDSSWSYYETEIDTATHNEKLNFPYNDQPAYPERMLKRLIDSLIETGIADKERIYLGGLSLGGFGTYDLLIRYPKYFAAAFPIAGACNLSLMVKKGRHIPIWIFHGTRDDVVDPSFDRTLYMKLKKKNKELRYTEYPDANHNSWDSAFAEPELLPWLFAHHR